MNVLRQNDVAIYCSKLSKVEISLEEQLERLKKYCKHFGLNIVKEYIDIDNVNKPMFKKMIENVKTKEFNIVLSYSIDTLSKNKDDIYTLVNELGKYEYELQLESSYKYKIIGKPLFKLDRLDNEIEEKNTSNTKKEKARFYPMFVKREVKKPKSDIPYNWVELLDEDNSWFEDNPIFDEEGNYLGTSTDVYVIMKELRGFGRIKLSTEEQEQKKRKETVKQRKLFEIDSNMNGKEGVANE